MQIFWLFSALPLKLRNYALHFSYTKSSGETDLQQANQCLFIQLGKTAPVQLAVSPEGHPNKTGCAYLPHSLIHTRNHMWMIAALKQ